MTFPRPATDYGPEAAITASIAESPNQRLFPPPPQSLAILVIGNVPFVTQSTLSYDMHGIIGARLK